MSAAFDKIRAHLEDVLAGRFTIAPRAPCSVCHTDLSGVLHIECANAACPSVHPSCKGAGLNAPRRQSLAADPDPTLISQLIETGRAEVTHGG